jgi:hypothetical protein
MSQHKKEKLMITKLKSSRLSNNVLVILPSKSISSRIIQIWSRYVSLCGNVHRNIDHKFNEILAFDYIQ